MDDFDPLDAGLADGEAAIGQSPMPFIREKQRSTPAPPSLLNNHVYGSQDMFDHEKTHVSPEPVHYLQNTVIRVIGVPPGMTKEALDHYSRFGRIVRWRNLSPSTLLVQFASEYEAMRSSEEEPFLISESYMCGAQLMDPKMANLFEDASESYQSPLDTPRKEGTIDSSRLQTIHRQRAATGVYGTPVPSSPQIHWYNRKDSLFNQIAVWLFKE